MAEETTETTEETTTSEETTTEETATEETTEETSEETTEETPTGDSELDKLRAELRKHRGTERRAKNAEKRAKEIEAKLKERENADKTEQEKAIEKAREEGKTEALTKAEKERRSDRLEVAVARAATKPFKIGDGDDAKTVKFADPEDAQVFLDRAISNGDLDDEDIFDENGKVKPEVVADALKDILAERPRLGTDSKAAAKPSGSADAGKGKGAAKELEDLSHEELYKRVQR